MLEEVLRKELWRIKKQAAKDRMQTKEMKTHARNGFKKRL